MQLTDLQWVRVASIIAAGIPIESVERSLGLQRYVIDKKCRSIEVVTPFVPIRTYQKILPLEAVPETWFSAAELRLLGVSIMGQGFKVAGRIATRCPPTPHLDYSSGEIFVVSARELKLYCLPKKVVLRWWELRPDLDSLSVKSGDQQIIDMLMRKLAVLLFDFDSHWSMVEPTSFSSKLIAIKDTKLTNKEKNYERESNFQKINRESE